MGQILKLVPKVDKKRLSLKQLVQWYVDRSEIKLFASDKTSSPEWLEIQFHGELSRIPALKNQRGPGGFPPKDIMARIKALDVLWHANQYQQINYGDSLLSGVLICASRGKRKFDADNCGTTIKDWLEPGDKQAGRTKKKRGWGIGIVDDDTNVQLLACKSEAFARSDSYSSLVITKLSNVRETLAHFVAAHYLGKLEKVVDDVEVVAK